jgi:hypothetical protein
MEKIILNMMRGKDCMNKVYINKTDFWYDKRIVGRVWININDKVIYWKLIDSLTYEIITTKNKTLALLNIQTRSDILRTIYKWIITDTPYEIVVSD